MLTPYQAGAVLQKKTKGLVLGNYVVLDKLGAGGGGMVFKARHRKLDRVVALKVLPPSVNKDPAAVLRFEREVSVAAQLRHPNLVAALDADEFQGLHFLVMEYVEGRDLAALVDAEGPLPPDRAVPLIVQAARGLEAAHAAGIVHRDIKPSNLMVDREGTVKVLDMGLARLTGAAEGLDRALTQAGSMMGTADYMAPEQGYDAARADGRSDIYSLGCTLYTLLTGRAPFTGDSLVQRVLAHRDQPIPSVPDAPPALDRALRLMMAKDPAHRQPSMAAVIADLEGFASAPGRRPRPRVGRLAAAAGLIVAASLGVAAALWPRGAGEVAALAPAGPRVTPKAPAVSAPAPKPAPIPTQAPTVAPAPTPTDPQPQKPRPRPRLALSRSGGIEEAGRLKGHEHRRVDGVAASPDGRRALSAGYDGTIRLWDLGTRQELALGVHLGPAYAVSFLADGRRALSAGEDGSVHLWDLGDPGDGRVLRELANLPGPGGRVFALAASPATTPALGIAGGAGGTVVALDLDARREVRRFRQDGRITSLAFLPDAHHALSGGSDRTVRVWDLSAPDGSPSEARRLDAGSRVLCLACSPTGRRALSGGHDGALTLWDLSGPDRVPLPGHPGDVLAAAFLTEDLALTADLAGALILWDLPRHREHSRTPAPGPGHRGLALLPDGRRALTADEDGVIRLWNLPVEALPEAEAR